MQPCDYVPITTMEGFKLGEEVEIDITIAGKPP